MFAKHCLGCEATAEDKADRDVCLSGLAYSWGRDRKEASRWIYQLMGGDRCHGGQYSRGGQQKCSWEHLWGGGGQARGVNEARSGHVSGRDICLPLVLRGPCFQVAGLCVSSVQEAFSTGGCILCVSLLSKCSVAAFCIPPMGSFLFSLGIVVGLRDRYSLLAWREWPHLVYSLD